jgi:hypothetical protein
MQHGSPIYCRRIKNYCRGSSRLSMKRRDLLPIFFEEGWFAYLQAIARKIDTTSGWCHGVAGGVFISVLALKAKGMPLGIDLKLLLATKGVSAVLGGFNGFVLFFAFSFSTIASSTHSLFEVCAWAAAQRKFFTWTLLGRF